jgi:hypothetical protein
LEDVQAVLHLPHTGHGEIKGIVSKLTIKFWMCQKFGKMKDYNQKKKKMTTSAVE